MKRGTLNFLGRKNQSLFDTNVKIKDMGEYTAYSSCSASTQKASIYKNDLLKSNTMFVLGADRSVKACLREAPLCNLHFLTVDITAWVVKEISQYLFFYHAGEPQVPSRECISYKTVFNCNDLRKNGWLCASGFILSCPAFILCGTVLLSQSFKKTKSLGAAHRYHSS